MITFRQVNIKNRPRYLFNDVTNMQNFDPSLLSIYLIFNNVNGYIECNSTEESNENKYLIFASKYKSKEVLKKYTELWDEIKNQIETMSGNKETAY